MDDRELLDLFRRPATRERAFAELVRRYEPRIYAHGLRMCGNREDAADLSQEVLIKIWRHLDGFEGRSALYSWIYRIATREALRLLEKRQRRAVQSLEGAAMQVPSPAEGPDAGVIDQRLREALDALPPRQRQVFVLRYLEEMPYREMAAVLETSEGALKASYHHAVHKIREFLEQQG